MWGTDRNRLKSSMHIKRKGCYRELHKCIFQYVKVMHDTDFPISREVISSSMAKNCKQFKYTRKTELKSSLG